MFGLDEGRAALAALGQGVSVDDAEEGFGLGVDPPLGAVQAGPGQAQAVLGAVELET